MFGCTSNKWNDEASLILMSYVAYILRVTFSVFVLIPVRHLSSDCFVLSFMLFSILFDILKLHPTKYFLLSLVIEECWYSSTERGAVWECCRCRNVSSEVICHFTQIFTESRLFTSLPMLWGVSAECRSSGTDIPKEQLKQVLTEMHRHNSKRKYQKQWPLGTPPKSSREGS